MKILKHDVIHQLTPLPLVILRHKLLTPLPPSGMTSFMDEPFTHCTQLQCVLFKGKIGYPVKSGVPAEIANDTGNTSV